MTPQNILLAILAVLLLAAAITLYRQGSRHHSLMLELQTALGDKPTEMSATTPFGEPPPPPLDSPAQHRAPELAVTVVRTNTVELPRVGPAQIPSLASYGPWDSSRSVVRAPELTARLRMEQGR